MIDKPNKSKKSFGFNIVCLKQNLVQQSQIEEKNQSEALKKYSIDITTSARITSNVTGHKNSMDDCAPQRLRKQDAPKSNQKQLKLNDTTVFFMSQSETPSSGIYLNKNLFWYQSILGKGGFGKVWRVEFKKNQVEYALKEMSKALIITKKSVPSVMNQKNLLSKLKHLFLVNMVASFQDRESLYLVMDLMPGGDLRHHIGKRRRFTEQQTKFIAANILICLDYLHQNNVIHRDIKPENIVFDNNGYLRITDLGIARFLKAQNSSDTSGTPGYMAPEVMCRQNHTFSVDYFALGVIVFELMLGKRPYLGRSRKEIRDQILARQAQIKKHEVPDGWSLESADFVNRLIQRKPTNRLGHNSSQQIRKHPWLRNFPWDKLMSKSLSAPYLPKSERSPYDQFQISSENTLTKQLIMENTVLLRRQQIQQLFKGYEQPFGDCTFL